MRSRPSLLAALLLCLAMPFAARGGEGKQAVRLEADDVVAFRALAARLPGPGEGLAVWLAPGRDPAPVLEWLHARGAAIVALSLRPEGARIQATVSGGPCSFAARAAELGARPEVAATGVWAVPETLNDDSIWVGQSGDSGTRATPVFDRGITGTGETVAVWDTGLDPDMCYFVLAPGQWSPAQSPLPPGIGTPHPGEKVIGYYVSPGASAYDPDGGHGTAVSGCVLGDDWATLSTPTAAGHDAADGNAPNARLVLLDGGVGWSLSGIVGDLTPVFQQSWDAGARIQNHSWGSPGLNLYAPDAADIDRFMWRHEDMLFVNANGNGGSAPDDGSVIDPAVCKNALGVGATSNGSAGARDLAGFSSRGPTFDGRIKPDVVAPGDGVRTASGSAVQGDDNCGSGGASGTSFAAPTATGWLALLRQYLREGWLPSGARDSLADGATPSAALLKAALVASAVPLEGSDASTGAPVDPPPSFNQGWGRPRLDNVLYFTGDPRRTTALDVRNASGLRTGQGLDLPLDVGSASEPLTVVLAWTDPPADSGAAAALVNDLDLVVTDPGGQRYLGNVWSGGQSSAGGSADTNNPLEAVKVATPAPGRWRIQVEAAKPLGRTGWDGSERQGFGLVATYAECGAAPSAVTGLSAQNRATSIDLAWNPVPGALGYLVYRRDRLSPPDGHPLLLPMLLTATAFADGEVGCDEPYSYQVRAWNGCALGPPSAAVAVTRNRGGCSARPSFAGVSDARPTGVCGEVALSWVPASSRCPCSTGIVYNVWAGSGPIDPDRQAPVRTCVGGTSVTLALGAGAGLGHFLVRAEDVVPGGTGPCGGVSDGNRVEQISAPLSPGRVVAMADDFDSGRGLWNRVALSGADAWDFAPEANASSLPGALVALDHGFASDSVALLLPAIAATSDSFVSFRHTFDLEGRYDGGVVELSTDGGANWSDAGSRLIQGGYTDWLMTGGDNSMIRPGYTGGALGPMTESLLWLGDLTGQSVRLRFRMLSDAAGRRERWAIDDVVVAERDCPAAPAELVAAFHHDAPACDGDAVAFDAALTWGGTPPYSFSWDFGDGSPVASGATVTHAFPAAGDYPVTLTARDAGVGQDQVIMPVRVVADAAPPAIANTLRAGRAGADAVLRWVEPAGSWMGAEIGAARRADLSDLVPAGFVAWDRPRQWTASGTVPTPPALQLWKARLRSECRGGAGPW